MTERIAVVGLGYVGLPVALAFARKFEDTVGFDVSEARVTALTANHDWTGEVTSSELEQSRLRLTSDRHARTKNGNAPHVTTGVAKSSCSHCDRGP